MDMMDVLEASTTLILRYKSVHVISKVVYHDYIIRRNTSMTSGGGTAQWRMGGPMLSGARDSALSVATWSTGMGE